MLARVTRRRAPPDDDAVAQAVASRLISVVIKNVLADAQAQAAAEAAAAKQLQLQPLAAPVVERCEACGDRLHVAWRQPDGEAASSWVVEWRGERWWWPKRCRVPERSLVAGIAAAGAARLSVRVYAQGGERRASPWSERQAARELPVGVRVRAALRVAEEGRACLELVLTDPSTAATHGRVEETAVYSPVTTRRAAAEAGDGPEAPQGEVASGSAAPEAATAGGAAAAAARPGGVLSAARTLLGLSRAAPDDEVLAQAVASRLVGGVIKQVLADAQAADAAAAKAARVEAAAARQRQLQPLAAPVVERCEACGDRLHVAWRQPDGEAASSWVVEWRGERWWWPKRCRVPERSLVAGIAAAGAARLSVRVYAQGGERRASPWSERQAARELPVGVRVRAALRVAEEGRACLELVLTDPSTAATHAGVVESAAPEAAPAGGALVVVAADGGAGSGAAAAASRKLQQLKTASAAAAASAAGGVGGTISELASSAASWSADQLLPLGDKARAPSPLRPRSHVPLFTTPPRGE